MEILTFIEDDKKQICEYSYDLISYAKEISNGMMVTGVFVADINSNYDYSNLNKYGLDKLYLIKTNKMEYDNRKTPYLILNLVKKINPDIFILNSTAKGRQIAPIIASNLETGLTADCTKLEIQDNKLISTRPTFGGKLMASIKSKNNPQMATLRVNVFKKKEFDKRNFEIVEFNFDSNMTDCPNLKLEILQFVENKSEFETLQNAKIIFAGGMGLKNKENFDKLKLLAEKFNAKVAGTRKAVDKNLIAREFQVGQTGSTITPDLYVAFGISGAIHHIVGMENSKKIIAINTDKNAPIFKVSDIGIIDDATKVIDELLNAI